MQRTLQSRKQRKHGSSQIKKASLYGFHLSMGGSALFALTQIWDLNLRHSYHRPTTWDLSLLKCSRHRDLNCCQSHNIGVPDHCATEHVGGCLSAPINISFFICSEVAHKRWGEWKEKRLIVYQVRGYHFQSSPSPLFDFPGEYLDNCLSSVNLLLWWGISPPDRDLFFGETSLELTLLLKCLGFGTLSKKWDFTF